MQDHLRPNKKTTYFALYIRFILRTPRIPQLEWAVHIWTYTRHGGG